MEVIDPAQPFPAPNVERPQFFLFQHLYAISFYSPTTTSNSTTHLNLLRPTICVRRRGSQSSRLVQFTRTARGRDWSKRSHFPTTKVFDDVVSQSREVLRYRGFCQVVCLVSRAPLRRLFVFFSLKFQFTVHANMSHQDYNLLQEIKWGYKICRGLIDTSEGVRQHHKVQRE